MRRVKLAIALLAVMVAMLSAFSGFAVAQDLNCRDAWGNLIRCDGDLYAPVDNGDYPYWYDDDDNHWWNDYWYGHNPYWYDDYYLSDEDCIGLIVGNECLGVG